jgi:hypothetical protein
MGKAVKNNKDKKGITDQYLEIARKYVDIELIIKENKDNKKDKIICKNCNNKKLNCIVI